MRKIKGYIILAIVFIAVFLLFVAGYGFSGACIIELGGSALAALTIYAANIIFK